jgi:hypothetical protein
MPDRDVFDRNVGSGWRIAARYLLLGDFDETALRSVIRALGTELRQRGCPGFAEAVDAIVASLHELDDESVRTAVSTELTQIRRQCRDKNNELLVNVSSQMVVSEDFSEHSEKITDDLRIAVATRVLSRLAIAWMSPALLIAEAVENGLVPYQTALSRRENAVATLVAQEATMHLAEQLLRDSRGSAIKVPRVARTKVPIDELLFVSLTD